MNSALVVALLVMLAVASWPRRVSRDLRRAHTQVGRTPARLAGSERPLAGSASTGSESGRAGLRAVLASDPVEIWRRHRAERRAERELVDLVPMLDRLAVALRAGLPVPSALQVVTTAHPGGQPGPAHHLLQTALDESVRGEPISRHLSRTAAGHPDPSLAFVAAAWSLSEAHGAPLAEAISHGAAQARRRRSLAAKLSVAVAGPLATVRVLMLLPLAGPLFGMVVGVAPSDQYFGTPAALAATLAGVGLVVVGRWWCRRMIRSVLPPGTRAVR